MKVAIGLKAHSGWAALIVLGDDHGTLEVIDRRRIELVDEEWAKQPYHAAEELEAVEARKLVKQGISLANQGARREIDAITKRARKLNHELVGCAVLVGEPMPDWSVDQILAVHFRMHKAEGVLFREALADAAVKAKLSVLRVPEKQLHDFAKKELSTPLKKALEQITALGKSIGAPFGKDQKDAALAAMIALQKH